MSQIINPERRDPGNLKQKSDVGLSKVDNYSIIELQDMVHSALREEYSKGDVYAVNELIEGKSLDIPLCSFTDSSSRATVTIGFLDLSNNLKSYIKANIKHSFKPSKVNGETEFEVSFESSPQRILPGSFKLYTIKTDSEKKAVLVLNLPSNTRSGYNVHGITINITEDLVSGLGDINKKNIKILDHTKINKLDLFGITDSSLDSFQVNFSNLDRTISDISRSLPIYNKKNELEYPEYGYNYEDGEGEDLDFPTINNVKFTGSKDTLFNGESLRNITISAQHSGSSAKEAGLHDFDVLNNIPVISYSPTEDGSSRAISRKITRESFQYTQDYGIGRAVNIPKKPIDTTAWGLFSSLSSILTSEPSDEKLITVGFLKRYTEILSSLLKNLLLENKIEYEDNTISISPNYEQYTTTDDFKVLIKSGESLKIYITDGDSKKETNKFLIRLSASGEEKNKFSKNILIKNTENPNIEFHEKIDILTNTCFSIENFNSLSEKTSFNLVFEKIINSSEEEPPIILSIIPLVFKVVSKSITTDNQVFNKYKRFFQVVPYSVVYPEEIKQNEITEIAKISEVSSDYYNCNGEDSSDTSKGLIWETYKEDNKGVISLNVGLILPSNSFENDIYDKNKYGFIKLYSTDPTKITAEVEDDMNDRLGVKIYYPTTNSNFSSENTNDEETTGNYYKFDPNNYLTLMNGGEEINNYDHEYSCILQIYYKKTDFVNDSFNKFIPLPKVKVYYGGSNNSDNPPQLQFTINPVSRPSRIRLGSTNQGQPQSNPYFLFNNYGLYQNYLPIYLYTDSGKLQNDYITPENYINNNKDFLPEVIIGGKTYRRILAEFNTITINGTPKDEQLMLKYSSEKNNISNLEIYDWSDYTYKKLGKTYPEIYYNQELVNKLSAKYTWNNTNWNTLINPKIKYINLTGFHHDDSFGLNEQYDWYTFKNPDPVDENISIGLGDNKKYSGRWYQDSIYGGFEDKRLSLSLDLSLSGNPTFSRIEGLEASLNYRKKNIEYRGEDRLSIKQGRVYYRGEKDKINDSVESLSEEYLVEIKTNNLITELSNGWADVAPNPKKSEHIYSILTINFPPNTYCFSDENEESLLNLNTYKKIEFSVYRPKKYKKDPNQY